MSMCAPDIRCGANALTTVAQRLGFPWNHTYTYFTSFDAWVDPAVIGCTRWIGRPTGALDIALVAIAAHNFIF